MLQHSPRAFPWEQILPWAPAKVRENAALRPESAGPGRGSASAKGAGASTCRGAGTSDIARSRNACGRSVAGRRRGGRPSTARRPLPKPGTPRQRKRAANRPSPRPRLLGIQRLRRRVVTQLKFFSLPLCDRPGCHEPPVTSVRNPARYCCPACRRAVHNVQDRERKWRCRGTLDGRTKRAYEYQAARQRRLRRRNTSASVPLRAPPG